MGFGSAVGKVGAVIGNLCSRPIQNSLGGVRGCFLIDQGCVCYCGTYHYVNGFFLDMVRGLEGEDVWQEVFGGQWL